MSTPQRSNAFEKRRSPTTHIISETMRITELENGGYGSATSSWMAEYRTTRGYKRTIEKVLEGKRGIGGNV